MKTKGYCSDVFTDAAINYIASDRTRPFFVYLPFNCPHAPLQVPESDYKPYRDSDRSTTSPTPKGGHPLPGPLPKDVIARVYGDGQQHRRQSRPLFAKLDELGLTRDTSSSS